MILFSRLQFILFLFAITIVTVFTVPSKLKLGMIYFHSYRYEKAFEYFNQVKAFDDDNVQALKKIKQYFLIHGDTRKALELQKKLVLIKPKNVDYLIELEKLYDWNLVPYEKLKVMEKRASLAKRDEDRDAILLEAANGYRWLRKYDDANRLFEKLKTVEDINFTKELIDYFLATRQVDNAIELLKKYTLHDKAPYSYNDFLSQAYLLKEDHTGALNQELILFMVDKKASRFAFSDSFLDSISSKDILVRIEHLERILFHYQKLDSQGVIQKIHLKLLKKLPHNYNIKFIVAESKYSGGDKEEAAKLYRELKNIPISKNEILFDISQRFSEMKKHNDAIVVLQRLSRAYPKNIEYLENLAEEYNESGKKKKALDIYIKIFKLEKRKVNKRVFHSLMNSQLLAFNKYGRRDKPSLLLNNPNVSPVIPMGNIRYRMGKIKTNLEKYKGRIIEILEEINNPKESLEIYLDLLETYPNDLELAKRVGYNYIELNDFESAYPYFERYLRANPKDKDSLEILAGHDISQKKYDTALIKLEEIKEIRKLENLNIYSLGMLEEVYFQLGKLEDRVELCTKILDKTLPGKNTKFQEVDKTQLEIRCLERAGNREEAYKLLTKLLKDNPEDPRLLTVIIYYEIELRRFDSARSKLDFLYSRRKYTEENKKQETYLKEAQEAVKFDYAWDLEVLGKYHFAKDYAYYQNDIRLGKRQSKYRIGLWHNQVLTFKQGNQDHGFIAPHITFFNEADSFEIGYYLSTGHKSLDAPIYMNGYFGRLDWMKVFLSYKNSHGEYANAELANEKKSYSRSFLAYFSEMHLMEKDIWDASLGFDSVTFRDEDGENVFANMEYLAPVGEKKQFHIGAQIHMRTLSSSGANVKRLYGDGSTSYFIVFRKEFTLNSEFNRTTKAAFKYSIGGDAKRNIGFGKSWDVLGEVYSTYGIAKSWRGYIEYFKETDNFSSGNSGNIGFSWNHWF
ncbi:MAG: tetratricopeptide (TPR) repeat protein [Bacteriovoracaceae bacterium]